MEKKAMREGYGETLVKLGRENENIVVLDADLSGSTKTGMFAKEFPERFFNMGIAEQDMVAVAAGLATVGKIPFASSFAMFASGRAWEIVRQAVCLGNKNVKICATHGGITVGEDGATHQALEDIAITRVLPHLSVIVPADYYEAKSAVEFAARHVGPVYIRMTRSSSPVLFGEDYQFEYGKVRVLKEGSDITVFACGIMVAQSLEAAKILEGRGISVKVVNVSTIKPIDVEGIIDAVKDTKLAITVEEHNVIGGLGGAVSEVLSENFPIKLKRIGIEDRFGRSGKADDLLKYFGLDAESIAEKIERFYSTEK